MVKRPTLKIFYEVTQYMIRSARTSISQRRCHMDLEC